MSNYTKLVNFAAKDSLPSGDAGKLIKGTEINTELNNIATAVNSKADSNSSALTGTPTAPTAAEGTNTTQIATTAYVYNLVGGLTATPTELNVLDGITATTAELNALDGITATVAELNILDGVTATTAEINKLDGVTATTTELNYVDGVTSNIQTQLNAKEPTQTAASQAEMEAGTQTATRSMSPLRVAQAIAALGVQTSANLALNGHWKDENTGLIINWGRTSNIPANNTASAFLDEAFTTAGLIAFATYYSTSPGLGDAVATYSLTTTTINVTNGSGATASINWLAIGY